MEINSYGTILVSGSSEWYSNHVTHNLNYKSCRNTSGDNYDFTGGTFSVAPYYIGEEILFGQPETSNGDLFSGGVCFSEDYSRFGNNYSVTLYDIKNTEPQREPFYLNTYSNGVFGTDVKEDCYITNAVINGNEIRFTLSGSPYPSDVTTECKVASIAFPNGSVANCVMSGSTWICGGFSDGYVIEMINNSHSSDIEIRDRAKGFLERASIAPGIEYKIEKCPFYSTVNLVYTSKLSPQNDDTNVFYISSFNLLGNSNLSRYDVKAKVASGIIYGGIASKSPTSQQPYSFGNNGISVIDGQNVMYLGNEFARSLEDTRTGDFSYQITEGCFLPSATEYTPDLAEIHDNVDINFPHFIAIRRVASGSNSYRIVNNSNFGDNIFDGTYSDIKYFIDDNNTFSDEFFDFNNYEYSDEADFTSDDLDSTIISTIRTTSSVDSSKIYYKFAASSRQHRVATGIFFYNDTLMNVSGGNASYIMSPKVKDAFSASDCLTKITNLLNGTKITGTSQSFTFTVGEFDDPNKLNSSIIAVKEFFDEKDISTPKKRVKTRLIKVYTGKDIVVLDENGNFTK